MLRDLSSSTYRRILRDERERMLAQGLKPYQADRVMGRALARVLREPSLRDRGGDLQASTLHLRQRLREEVQAETERQGLGATTGR